MGAIEMNQKESFFKKSFAGFFIYGSFFIVIAGCLAFYKLNNNVAPAELKRSTASQHADYFVENVQPILKAKCITCHGCSSSPCEMKLDSYDGIMRGALKEQIFGTRLKAVLPARMKDAQSVEEWRARGFFSVIDENKNPSDSILYSLIEAGSKNNVENFPLTDLEKLMTQSQEVGKRECPDSIAANKKYLKENLHGGMPLALPGLNSSELEIMAQWIKMGAPGPQDESEQALAKLNSAELSALQNAERFFNSHEANSRFLNRVPLVSRYLYEHLFMAHIELEEIPGRFFELVRSRTAHPKTISEIVTETPLNDPKVENFTYRLKPVTEVIVQKSHMVWRFDQTKRKRLNELFYNEKNWPKEIKAVDYSSQNPFLNFAQIPAVSRAYFMLEESRLMTNGMIRGPVCTGNAATFAIRDDFWIFFAQPEKDITVLNPFLQDPSLPVSAEDAEAMLSKEFSGMKRYRKRFEETVRRLKPQGFSLEDIWDGNANTKANAALTVLRHEANATVLDGMQGPIPRSLWFVSYAGIERIFYNLVPQYRYWGDSKHRIHTWSFMSNIRQEYEDDFISLLPQSVRKKVRSDWTKGFGDVVLSIGHGKLPSRGRATSIKEIKGADPVESTVMQISQRIGKKAAGPFDNIQESFFHSSGTEEISEIKNLREWESALGNLSKASLQQNFAQFLPDVTHVMISDGNQSQVYSLLVNRGYDFNNFVLAARLGGARSPKDDRLIALRGIVGDFPSLMVEISIQESANFLIKMRAIDAHGNKEFLRFRERYSFTDFQSEFGVLRNNSNFWNVFERFSEWNQKTYGTEAGILDLTRYLGYEQK